ncbi:MAG: multidrug transporter AcrB [Moraxellaceae bacterium]|nr:MAG: multidrug transporter AcrB [Moraxellaceae bacterium]
MNLAEWSIRHRVIMWTVTFLLAIVGAISFDSLSRLEDPEFTIKEALIITPYPGASAVEVEEEVTDLIERAAQEMGQLDAVESRSSRGLSIVKVVMKDKYDATSLPQIWDELRRKVGDTQRRLPPGAGPSIVKDDFGDVFGVFIALTGEGYTSPELYEFAKYLRRELLTARDVKKIDFYGVQQEVIYIEMLREKMSNLGVSPNHILRALGSKNTAVSAGFISIGVDRIAISPTGEFHSEQEFGELLIGSNHGLKGGKVFLRDVAKVVRGFKEPADNFLRYDGKPAVGLAISTASGGNVVEMGKALDKKIELIKSNIPLGIEMNPISIQYDTVTESINGFLINLAEAIVIVIVVLLVFMGLRSGLIIGAVLVVTIMGTFVFMAMLDVTLERISLGALIIALGMLVDNAIVVTDGIRIRINRGEDKLKAASAVVAQTSIPLLGATVIAITAFAAIGTNEDSTGEYTRSLFTVILISLSMSWVTAVTITPMLCDAFLTPDKKQLNQNKDPYGGKFYVAYRHFLAQCINFRWLTIGLILAVFCSSLYGFGFLKNSFFPNSTRPQFFIDLWFPEGTRIDETYQRVIQVENKLQQYEGVTHLTSQVGGGEIRFHLTYTPEYNYPSFARILVDVDDFNNMPALTAKIQDDLEDFIPEANTNVRVFVNGPSSGGKIQLRILGPDRAELRRMADKALVEIEADPGSKAVRNEWRSKVKVLRPQFSDSPASAAGVQRGDVAKALKYSVEGVYSGVFREGDELLPIIARAPKEERVDLESLDQIQVWSPAAQQHIPIGQVVSRFETKFEDPYIWRWNRVSMIRIHVDPRVGLPSELLERIKPKVEQSLGVDLEQYSAAGAVDENGNFTSKTIPIRWNDQIPIAGMPGYYMAWGGEAELSVKASGQIASALPVFFGLMVFIVICLFNSIKKTLVIWMTVPLAVIGVTVGLLIFNQPFGFMSLLGFMSLAGMLIKNAIVLVDQIDVELDQGKPPYQAILDAGVSRLIPVAMAALTTILGMLPLLADAFFISMAVTIMFGLLFASVLTLVVVPVFYAAIFNVKVS